MTVDPNSIEIRDRAADGKLWVLAVYVSYLIGVAIIGVIIAYVKRADLRNTIWESHIEYAIRTFWIGLVVAVIGFVLMIILIGAFVLWLLGIWLLVRVVFGIVKAISDQPIRNPETWLIDL